MPWVPLLHVFLYWYLDDWLSMLIIYNFPFDLIVERLCHLLEVIIRLPLSSIDTSIPSRSSQSLNQQVWFPSIHSLRSRVPAHTYRINPIHISSSPIALAVVSLRFRLYFFVLRRSWSALSGESGSILFGYCQSYLGYDYFLQLNYCL